MGIIIVFDKSSQESFNWSEKYYREAKDHACDELVFLLLGNKSDLESFVDLS